MPRVIRRAVSCSQTETDDNLEALSFSCFICESEWHSGNSGEAHENHRSHTSALDTMRLLETNTRLE